MNEAVRIISHRLSYLDHFADDQKLLIVLVLIIFAAIPVDIIAQFATASFLIYS